ncbi:MAG TPA: glycine cleavage system aminomethyltransferase GcvT, partial [Steroidobacteraceae bacterium]|nr:glycine cleavage system aminomethyltransferase GcvT [Steroidobacteraceae bacterium]
MCVVDLAGSRVRPFLRHLLANDVAKLKTPGKALYGCMLNESGGVIDDLITYFLDDDHFRLVVNAGTRDKDIAWIRSRAAEYDVAVEPRLDLAMIAVQGPAARERAGRVLGPVADGALDLAPFVAGQFGPYFIARTGYTGEDGWEIVVPATEVVTLWSRFVEAGIAPCGLGARDTLRLEAGMNLYGNDMDESVTPLESGLAWTVAMTPEDRAFVGRAALERQQHEGVPRKLVGLLLEDRGVLRAHQPVVVPGAGTGEVTSGTFSPTLERSIGLARVPTATEQRVEVEIRGKGLPARVVKPPFVRNGKICISL